MQTQHLAPECPSPQRAPVYCVGEVIAAASGGFAVRSEPGVLGTHRAASCLIVPELGDTVLVGGESADRAYILAVLERANRSPCRLAVEGDLQVEASGSLRMKAGGGIDLSTLAAFAIAARELTVQSGRATLLLEHLKLIGGEVGATIGKLRFVGDAIESVVDRFMQSARHSLRLVEGADQLRSGSLDYRSQENMNLHGRNLLASAKELVKVDGSQIHLG